MTFLETFFFGNVDPQSRAVKPGSRADKLRIYITDHLPEIENALPDEQRGVLEKIMDAQGELDTISHPIPRPHRKTVTRTFDLPPLLW